MPRCFWIISGVLLLESAIVLNHVIRVDRFCLFTINFFKWVVLIVVLWIAITLIFEKLKAAEERMLWLIVLILPAFLIIIMILQSLWMDPLRTPGMEILPDNSQLAYWIFTGVVILLFATGMFAAKMVDFIDEEGDENNDKNGIDWDWWRIRVSE